MVEVKKKAIKKWLRSKLQSEVRQVALWSHCLRCCWCLLGAVSSYYKCTVHFNEPNNRPTTLHSVWFSTDAITLVIVATQLSGSGHTIQIHSTPSALDHQLMAANWGHQVAAVDTWSCRYKRANMKDGTCVHTAMCTCVWERLHRCDVMCESVSQPHRWSIVRELTNKSGHKALKANSERIPQPYHTHQHKAECPVYWEKYLDFNNFILQTPRRRWTLNIECIISASTFQHTWFW